MKEPNMTEEQAVDLLREFLAEHPEHIHATQGIMPGETEPETLVDLETFVALVEWAIRTDRSGNPAKARRFLEFLREKFGK
jgi:hypothetical protein